MAELRSDERWEAAHGRGYYVGLGLMGLLYIGSGINHFAHTQTYVPIMPPYIPWPVSMIHISGLAEVLGGVGVLVPDGFVFKRTRWPAAWGLVALLIAIWPVHFNMLVHPEMFPGVAHWVIWIRVPLQIPLMAWAWVYTRR